ncbi:sugar transferase [Pseudoruegeria sp. HB172150]|uniref:sugar transferase n=1 Tax=Pseudoruegeria sp. HB172150 TaxID=2721164 RepID=UPI0027381BC7|nr:sugar transferase [Pseudoruegeria sp. HB172150]
MTPAKRVMDLALGLLMAVCTAPSLLLIALVILLVDGRPVFYSSERMRTPVRSFRLIKFRTMTIGSDDAGVSGGHKSRRLTRCGRFLRRTRLDELPQIWNVVAGDISLVGPRPPLRTCVEANPEIYELVLQSRPGITGLATLYFHRHEERLLAECNSAEEAGIVYARRCVARKARLDLIYQRRQSLGMDLRLLMLTAAFPLRVVLGQLRPVLHRYSLRGILPHSLSRAR